MHKSSKPMSPSAHFLGSRPWNTVSFIYDPNLIMAALFMDLFVALTCGCLILFKTMLFICAWVLTELLPHPVNAWKQMSPLSILGEKKLSPQYCLKLSCNYNPAYDAVFNSKFNSVFARKPTQLPPLAIRVSGDPRLVSTRVMLLHLLYQPHHLGF